MCQRQLLDQMSSHVKNSNDIDLKLHVLNELHDNLILFAADTPTMCPNINTEEGLMFLKIAPDNLIFKVEPDWSRKVIINAIKLLLLYNVFHFGDTFCRKKSAE